MNKFKLNTLSLLLLTSTYAFADLEKAIMYKEHGLKEQAKAELIDSLFSTKKTNVKSQVLYELGNIAYEENNVSLALETWRKLVKSYPQSQYAATVKDRISQLAEIVGETSKSTLNNAIAASYLKHADFWSNDKDNRFTIDSSWMPKVEMSLEWYNKVINDYPKSEASSRAYVGKIRTLLGWKESGKYGSSYGIRADYEKYMPQVIATFSSFEEEHPDASTLQAFRYQIAQAYWSKKDWVNTKKWLNYIVDKAGVTDSFYKQAALYRLKKVEY